MSPPDAFRTLRSPRPVQALAMLLAWLLLTLQVPWHTGMAAGHALGGDRQQLAGALGLRCGPLPDARTLAALVDAGYLSAKPATGDGDTPCDLFTGLAAASTVSAVVFTLPGYGQNPPQASQPAFRLTAPAWRQPPARAPPAIS